MSMMIDLLLNFDYSVALLLKFDCSVALLLKFDCSVARSVAEISFYVDNV